MIPLNLEIGGVSRLLMPFRGVTSCRTLQRFLRNGVCRRTRHSDQIEPVMNIRCRRQITHGRFQRLVSHPVLDSSYVETPPEHAGGIRGPEGLQIEFFRIETGALSDQFAASQEILFPIAGR
jgi:hypothetical protein